MKTVDCRSKEEKKEARKEKLNEAKDKMLIWLGNNWYKLVLGAFGTIVMTRATVTEVMKIKNAVDKENEKRRIWDPSLGYHLPLKHELRDSELTDLAELEHRGFSRYEALKTLGLIR